MNETEKTEYVELCNKFQNWFDENVGEFGEAVKRLGPERDLIRIRLLLAFSFLEIMTKVYAQYYDLHLGNKALLEGWLRDYCLTAKNSFYASHPYLNRTTETHLYQFRCSVMHAFTIPTPENGTSIAVPNGDDTASNVATWDTKMSAAGHRVAFISTGSLMKLFIKGVELLVREMGAPVGSATLVNLEGMRRVVDWLRNEGVHNFKI